MKVYFMDAPLAEKGIEGSDEAPVLALQFKTYGRVGGMHHSSAVAEGYQVGLSGHKFTDGRSPRLVE